MGTLIDIIVEEKERLEELLKYYQDELKKYPRGNISKKKRNDHYYCYRCYREKDTVVSIYLGKEDSKAVKEAGKKVEARQEVKKKIKRIKENLAEAKGLLHGKRKNIS